MVMTEDEVLALFERVSNIGRWGPADERGTLNLITDEKRRAALALARSGRVLPLGRPLVISGSTQHPPSAMHVMTTVGDGEISAQDLLVLSPHGFEMTHVDAVGHTFHEGRAWNGRPSAGVYTDEGLRFGAITAAAEGIVTRGILLDVAAARGVDHLERGAGITADDLDRAATLGSARVESGDAVFIRTGLGLRVQRGGVDAPDLREGVLPDVVGWLRDHDVALYSGDCIERLPSGYPRFPLPLHQIGMVAMGLSILDNPDVEALAGECRAEGRNDFLLMVAPLRLPGGTASAVNPLAIF